MRFGRFPVDLLDCDQRHDGVCAIASELANQRVTPHRSACDLCQRSPQPRAVNRYTVAIAVGALLQTDPAAAAALRQKHELSAPRPPSWAQQAWSLAAAVAGYVTSGFATVDADTYARRLATCDACEHRQGHHCRLCGCFVRPKAALPREHCPAVPSRWPGIDAKSEISDPIDILLPLGRGSQHDNLELRAALRSIERFATGYHRVVVVGAIPPWLRATDRVRPVPRSEFQGNKASRISSKVLWAFDELSDLTDTVAFWNDDYVLTRPCDVRTIADSYHGSLCHPHAKTHWQKLLEHTGAALAAAGIPNRHYDVHVPMRLERAKFQSLRQWWDRSRKDRLGYVMKSVYGNNWCHATAIASPDRKLGAEWQRRIDAEWTDRWVFSHGEDAMRAGFGRWLLTTFPDPTPAETRPHQTPGEPQRLVCVVGPYRSGTSAVAGLLHRLGVPMGDGWKPARPGNAGGTYEDQQLATMCRRWFRETSIVERVGRRQRRRDIRQWLAGRPQLAGAKHPLLCLCLPQLARVCPSVQFVAVDRPVSESVTSLIARRWSPAHAARATSRLIAARERDLATIAKPVCRIAYHDLLANPADAVDRLIAFLDLTPTEDQRRDAISWIDPAQQTVRGP